jgi:hypothetical protein
VTNRMGRGEIHSRFESSGKFMNASSLVSVNWVMEFGW